MGKAVGMPSGTVDMFAVARPPGGIIAEVFPCVMLSISSLAALVTPAMLLSIVLLTSPLSPPLLRIPLSVWATSPSAFVAFCRPFCSPVEAAELALSTALASAWLAFSVSPGARVVANNGSTGAMVDTKLAASVGMRLATVFPIAGLIDGRGPIVGIATGAIVGIGGIEN